VYSYQAPLAVEKVSFSNRLFWKPFMTEEHASTLPQRQRLPP